MSGGMPVTLWLPALAVALAVAVALASDAFGRPKTGLGALVGGLLLAGLACLVRPGAPSLEALDKGLVTGGGFTTLPGLAYVLTALTVAAAAPRLAQRARGVGTGALMALGALFAHALVAAVDVRLFFVALAGLTVVGYPLVAAAGTRRAEESAVRYFVQGAVASGLTVWGLALLVGLGGGMTGYLDVAGAIAGGGSRSGLLALALVASAVAFKMGAFPFHAWLPDAYETADPAEAAFLASAPKLAALLALLVLVRGTVFAAPAFAPATGLLVALSIGSLVFGALGMVRQRLVQRLLGYSAIAQAGYGAAAVASSEGAVNATVLFVATYALGVASAFVALEAVRHVRPQWDGSLDGLAGLSREAPALAAALAVSMLSLTGIPLFAGFWGKLAVFTGLVRSDLLVPAVVAALAAVVSFGGYGAVIRHAYFEEVAMPPEARRPLGLPGAVACVFALAVIAAGVLPLVVGLEPVLAYLGLA